MSGIQDRKAQNPEKLFPGCLGRVVNLFDLRDGVAGNRLLMDKPHCNGYSPSHSQSEVARMSSASFGEQIEDKVIVSELRISSSNKRANGTPMKTLIAQEMSKEVKSKHNPPNVIAKLMGLDALPHQQPNSATQRSCSKGYSRRSLSHSGMVVECLDHDSSFLDNQMQSESHQCRGQNEYKDVYEIWQQSPKINVRDSSPRRGSYNENINEKKMALIRQKFMELKCLATDEKGRQTKEFQDALEVLSSNEDLFLKFLQEPNSMFSQHLYNMQSILPPPETKRITVLRPSKVVDNENFAGSLKKNDKQTKKTVQMDQAAGWEKSNAGCSPTSVNQRVDEYPNQPTRIVVLKPSPGKTREIKAVVPPAPSSSRILHDEEFYDDPEDDEAQEPREVAREITQQMRGNLIGHRRDETLLSSVFSNGYIGDDSSFNKSENEYARGNLSDSEIMSPTSRHSWDYINRFGSPYSCSSFSRASCSPESSVCREAKKRLSERWAMMASNGSIEVQKNARRSSSTLGEMLALSDIKKAVKSEEEAPIKEQEPRGSTSCSISSLNMEGMADSPISLLRSKSVPGSSTVHSVRLDTEGSNPEAGKAEVPRELTKAKSMKSSLKGKVSSLFFSRNKKSSQEKLGASQSKDESQAATPETPGSPIPYPGKISDNASQCTNNGGLEKGSSPSLRGSSSKTNPNLISMRTNQGVVLWEGGLSVAKPVMPGNASENQDQPSPISVLEPPFEEDDSTIGELCGNIKPNRWGTEASLKSNLIDKSPPIESIARTLSWNDSCVETATPYPLNPTMISSTAEEEQDWFLSVQTLLTVAGLDGKVQSDSFLARWHSPESPLDPSLRDKFAIPIDKELPQVAKRRQWGSNRKLVFDCVNAALLEITGYGSGRSVQAMLCSGVENCYKEGASRVLVDQVWDRMKKLFFSEVRCTFSDGGDCDSLVVERVVKKEVVGKGWVDNMRLELGNLGKEIERTLLEELVEEAVVDLTGRV